MKNQLLLLGFIFAFITQTSAQNNSRLLTLNDSLISKNISFVNKDSIAGNILDLQNFGTRFMLDTNRRQVALSIMDKFASYGLTNLRLDSFLCFSDSGSAVPNDTFTWQYNVEAKIIGTENPDNEIIVMGHYDDFVYNFFNPDSMPGADDNASGTAAALECARVLMEANYQARNTIVFLATAAEELMGAGDFGSKHYATQALADGRDIKMVINNDMIAYDEGDWEVRINNYRNSVHITNLAIDIIENYTTLNYKSLSFVQSIGADIEPFIDAGYCGVYFMESAFNPNYHKETDILDNCNIDYAAEVTKISVGMISKYDLVISNNEKLIEEEHIRLFPNPTKNELNISIAFSSDDISYAIYNQIGQNISGFNIIRGKGLLKINTSSLKPGVYFILFKTAKQKVYKKFIKTK